MFEKKLLIENINAYIQAILSGNEKLIKLALNELEKELDKLPEIIN